MTEAWYGSVLSEIHDDNYSFLARAAAATAMSMLPKPEESGIVVDLGCGSGVTAQILNDVGYSVVGIDASPEMVALARQRVPSGHFRIESIYGADIPDCQAVLAIGEVLNYQTEDRTPDAVALLLRSISRSLRPEGFLLCDIAGPGRAAATPAVQRATGDAWVMNVSSQEDSSTGVLTRSITMDITDQWHGRAASRDTAGRSAHLQETHLLELIEPADFTSLLCANGLDGKQLPGYADFDLPTGWTAWLARPIG